jgi:hypothetical protein
VTTHDYVQRVLALYRRIPGTSGLARRADRSLAASLHQRCVPLDVVDAALLTAALRRASRPADAAPLPRIASLHYFLPVIDELLAIGLDPDYLDYLRYRFSALTLPLHAPDHHLP